MSKWANLMRECKQAAPLIASPAAAPREEDAQFAARVADLQLRCYLSRAHAEATALRLLQRDRDGTDLRLCLECQHNQRRRCANWRRAGLTHFGAGLPEVMVDVMQRCPGFSLVYTLDAEAEALAAGGATMRATA